MNTQQFIVACAFGLEAVAKRELQALHIDARIVQPGKLVFEGDWTTAINANLWLRTADRVALLVKQFDAHDFDALFDTTREIQWSQWIPADGRFPVVGRSRNSQLTSVPAIQRSVKRSVVESLQRDHGTELPESGATFGIEIALLDNLATLTIDLTGPSLHKRGYRKRSGEAPLKETLAAALVLLSFWNRERPLHDPFCGSGTIPIEAAMIGKNIAPGRTREFPAEHWACIPNELWADLRNDAHRAELPTLEERVVGTDIDASVLTLARQQSEWAGVADSIHWQQLDFADLMSKKEFGCLITNPPYGERLQDQTSVAALYQTIPSVLQRLPSWSHYILTSFPRFESTIQKFADRRRKLFNGRIECTYFQYHGPRPGQAQKVSGVDEPSKPSQNKTHVSESAPVFGGIDSKAREQAQLFENRLVKRARHLRRWPSKRGITCYRIYEKDIPEIPLVIDRYENCLHITEYERPHNRDLGAHAAWLELMAKTAAQALDVERRNVFLKQRIRQRGERQHEKIASRQNLREVSEGGLKFLVNLEDYVDTGLFLDHRETRKMFRDESSGKHVLNLFAYTGSFSVYAADGGALSTTTVDWSNTYLNWAKSNMALNGFDSPSHEFVRSDALEFVKQLKPQTTFDLVIVDPPTFSNSKRSEEVWDIQRDYVELLTQLVNKLPAGAIIYFSNNFKRFKFDEQRFSEIEIREISKQTIPEDFRNRRIHRCWRMVK